MSDTYLTVACPAGLKAVGTQLAIALGQSFEAGEAAWREAFDNFFQDAGGNVWHVMSMPVSRAFVTREAPHFEAHPLVLLWTGTGPVPTALNSPAKLIAVVGMPGVQALQAVGLRPMQVDP